MNGETPRAVLLCYACEPGTGSEEGVGWTWAGAAAQIARVTMITSARSADAVRAAVADQGLAIDVRVVDLPERARRLFPRKLIFVHYVIWQALAARLVRALEREGHVDVVHHVTWASDSLPSALLASRAPVRIWGPVGGATTTARALYPYLTPRGKVEQLFRDAFNLTMRAVAGRRVARHATLIAAQNHDVVAAFEGTGRATVLEANAALLDEDLLAGADQGDRGPTATGERLRTGVFAARLIPWKGLLLAVRSLEHAPDWRLLVAGEGPDRARAEALAAQLGVGDRITYLGRIPRDEVLAHLRGADALVMPSFHDAAAWVVAEASALGCPVVCLDRGGPPHLAGVNGHVVAVGDGDRLPERFAAVLDAVPGRGERDRRWSADRLPGLLAGWYAGGRGAAADGAARPAARPEPEAVRA